MQTHKYENYKVTYREGTSDNKVIDEIFYGKAYSKRKLTYEASETWLDLGANIGCFAFYIADKVAKIESYEPDYESYSLLRYNVKQNGLHEKINTYNLAVTNRKDKMVGFYTNEQTGQHWRNSTCNKKPGSRQDKVKNIHYLELLKSYENQDINIKMDIEGSEIDILLDIDFEKHSNIKKIIFEWSFDVEPNLNYYRAVIKKLEKHFEFANYKNNPLLRQNDVWQKSWFPPYSICFAVR